MLRQQQQRVPFTVVRPTHIVGDSRTGEVDHLGGIYALIALLVTYPPELPAPLPTLGDAPLHLVPVDYVVEAAYELGQLDAALSRTFHLTEDDPPTAREAFELLAERAGRSLPRRFIPVEVARSMLKLPGVRRLTGNPRAVIDLIAHRVPYDTINTRRTLAKSGLSCPRFAAYCGSMVAQVRGRLRRPSP
jgi:thioester reductase-like protein